MSSLGPPTYHQACAHHTSGPARPDRCCLSTSGLLPCTSSTAAAHRDGHGARLEVSVGSLGRALLPGLVCDALVNLKQQKQSVH